MGDTGEKRTLSRDWFIDAARRMQEADEARARGRVARILAAQDAIPEGLRSHPAAVAVLGAVASDMPLHPAEATRLRVNYEAALAAFTGRSEAG